MILTFIHQNQQILNHNLLKMMSNRQILLKNPGIMAISMERGGKKVGRGRENGRNQLQREAIAHRTIHQF